MKPSHKISRLRIPVKRQIASWQKKGSRSIRCRTKSAQAYLAVLRLFRIEHVIVRDREGSEYVVPKICEAAVARHPDCIFGGLSIGLPFEGLVIPRWQRQVDEYTRELYLRCGIRTYDRLVDGVAYTVLLGHMPPSLHVDIVISPSAPAPLVEIKDVEIAQEGMKVNMIGHKCAHTELMEVAGEVKGVVILGEMLPNGSILFPERIAPVLPWAGQTPTGEVLVNA